MPLRVDVEYCGSCGYKKQFQEMTCLIRKMVPDVEVTGAEGRQASFEVKLNDELVYSKLRTLAFPDFYAVSMMAKEVDKGKPATMIQKQQPITECAIS